MIETEENENGRDCGTTNVEKSWIDIIVLMMRILLVVVVNLVG